MKVLNEYVLIALFLLLLLLLLFLMYIVKVRATSSLPTPDSEKVTAARTAMTLIEILNGLCEQNYALYLFSLISCSFTNRSGLQFLSVRTSAVLLKQKLSYEFEKVSHNED